MRSVVSVTSTVVVLPPQWPPIVAPPPRRRAQWPGRELPPYNSPRCPYRLFGARSRRRREYQHGRREDNEQPNRASHVGRRPIDLHVSSPAHHKESPGAQSVAVPHLVTNRFSVQMLTTVASGLYWVVSLMSQPTFSTA